MEDTQKQIVGALDKANNVLVTVSRNPSVDQLSAAIGLTLALNKLGKHAIAVFSGQVPSTIEFLQPEKTLEKTTDSLRDFIISLDKNKADKLRYKVEDDMVKIFITPYKTSLSQDDLEFSQGDFNVEVVMALGVHEQTELDQAITAHGRILHDATVVGMTVSGESHLGSINWANPTASSLSEMLAGIVPKLKENIFDNQIATAFLTGIVAETERFSNDKTSPDTMQISSQLMAAGANQQLVATQLEQPVQAEASNPEQPAGATAPKPHHDGSLEIQHDAEQTAPDQSVPDEHPDGQIHIDEHGQLGPHPGEQPPEDSTPEQLDNGEQEAADQPESEQPSNSRRPMALTPPVTGGKLTANTEPETLSPSTDVLGDGAVRSSEDRPNLSRRDQDRPSPTLEDIEKSVSSPHMQQSAVDEQPGQPTEQPVAPDNVPLPPPVSEEPTMTTVEPEPPVSPPEPEAPSPELVQPADTPPLTPGAPNPLEDARNAVMAAMDNHEQPDTITPQGASSEPSQPDASSNQEAQVSDDGTLTVHPAENPEPFGPPAQPNVNDPNAPPEVPPPFMPPSYPPNNEQNQQ